MTGVRPLGVSEADALASCETEPIRTPDRIQAHGALVVARRDLSRITHVSANIETYFRAPVSAMLGASLSDVLVPEDEHTLRNALSVGSIEKQREYLGKLQLPGGNAVGAVHVSNDSVVIEMSKEPAPGQKAFEGLEKLRWFLSRRADDIGLATALEAMVRNLRAISGFERVMAYRFRPDGSGEVIAEARSLVMESYLNLRFPSQDIPRIARQICLEQSIRIIADTNTEDVPLLASGRQSASVDLTLAELRGTSEVHRRYLRNMGVGASLVLPVIVGGRLWGLFSCHNRAPRFLTVEETMTFDLVGQILNTGVSNILEREQSKRTAEAQAVADAINIANDAGMDTLFSEKSWNALADYLLSAFSAQGVLITHHQKRYVRGLEVALAKLPELAEELEPQPQGGIGCSSFLGGSTAFVAPVAGAMRIDLDDTAETILWLFRAEENEVVTWAGSPQKQIEQTSTETRLHPRSSFRAYEEISRGRSKSWEPEDISLAEAFQNALRNAIDLRLERNRRERKLGLVAQELNHRVRNTISLVRSLTRQTASEDKPVRAFTEELEKRFLSLAGAHDLISSMGHAGADLEMLLRQELKPFDTHEFTLSGPAVRLSVSSATIFVLAVHEMVTNAAKYGALSVPNGTVSVSWEENNGELQFKWIENSELKIKEPDTTGFGTFLLTEGIAHQFGNNCKIEFVQNGISISFSVPHGEFTCIHAQSVDQNNQSIVIHAKDKLKLGTVLILEDNFLIAIENRRCLRLNGVSKVVLANTNEKAREKVDEFVLDAAVLDVSLSETDSLETAELLRKKNIPFIFLTGYASDDDRLSAFDDVPVLKKPIDPDQMLPALALAIETAKKKVPRDENPAA